MIALELCDVSKVYGEGASEVHALQNVSLSVDAGTMVAVMGPSRIGQEHAAHDRRVAGGAIRG